MTVDVDRYGLVRCSECEPGGVLMDRRTHGRNHREWKIGVLVPAATLRRVAGPIVRVSTHTSPAPLRKLAYQTARVVRREGRWDFASFSYHPPGGGDREGQAYLRIEGNRAIGYLVGYIDRFSGSDHPHLFLGPMWTAGAHRRRGVCRELFDAAAADATIPIAWLGPFTDAGRQFADAVDPDHRIPTGH